MSRWGMVDSEFVGTFEPRGEIPEEPLTGIGEVGKTYSKQLSTQQKFGL